MFISMKDRNTVGVPNDVAGHGDGLRAAGFCDVLRRLVMSMVWDRSWAFVGRRSRRLRRTPILAGGLFGARGFW
jgi:hypothetical protein